MMSETGEFSNLKQYLQHEIHVELEDVNIKKLPYVYRHQLKYGSLIYAEHYFFDINEKTKGNIFKRYLNDENFLDFGEIQELIFGDSFYYIRTDRRWSLYLHFVCENQNILDGIRNKYLAKLDASFAQKNFICREQLKSLDIFQHIEESPKSDEQIILAVEGVQVHLANKVNLFFNNGEVDLKGIGDKLGDDTLVFSDKDVYDCGIIDVIKKVDSFRNLVLRGSKLAVLTSNDDVVNIFRRKFSLFKEDFASFTLIRDDDGKLKITKHIYDPETEGVVKSVLA